MFLYAGAGDKAQRVRLDVPRGRLFFRREKHRQMRATVHGFERFRLSAHKLHVIGSAGPDHIEYVGCHGVVDGARARPYRGGLHPRRRCGYLSQTPSRSSAAVAATTASSAWAANILVGGPGDDVAVGGRATTAASPKSSRPASTDRSSGRDAARKATRE